MKFHLHRLSVFASVWMLLIALMAPSSLDARDFMRGDINEDGSVNIADGVNMLDYMFVSGFTYCVDANDIDDDGDVNVTDAVNLFGYLFSGASPPAAPFTVCGPDPTPDSLGCESYATCTMGDAIPGLDQDTFESFVRGRELTAKQFSPEEGLGPFYNAVSCASCHSTPVVGGSAPLYRNFFFAAVGQLGSQSPIWDPPGVPSIVMPSYTYPFGPRPAFPDPSQVGNQPVTVAQRNAPPGLGVGLFEQVSNQEIACRADPADSDGDGISGRFNTDGFGNMGRFGYKLQANFLEAFLRGAINNQMGITTDPFFGSSGIVSSSMMQVGASYDESTIDGDSVADPEISVVDFGDIVIFSQFVAPSPTGEMGPEEQLGEEIFADLGCVKCHVPEIESAYGPLAAYTDLLLHDMGPELADGISMGMPQFSPISPNTTGSEWRTQPLWGVRLHGPWLHDGRADTLHEAIILHGGEAESIRQAYEALPAADQEAVIRFLEAL